MFKIRDDRGRELVFARAPERIVSLVPSDTFTIAELVGVDRIVGRTDYCEEPRGSIEAVPSVGGTKDAKIQAILDLRPDLVVANQEENTRATLEAVAQAGVAVFVVFPKRVEDGVALVARYARMLGVEKKPNVIELVRALHRALDEANRWRETITPVRTFCPIWMGPPGVPEGSPSWVMTIHGATFMSDALDLAGAQNVFADRERRYPLAADLGKAKPLPKHAVLDRDARYPRVTMDEVVARAPELVLLPDEPHPFTEDDAKKFRALDIPAAKNDRVVSTAGKDVCWYGAWSVRGIPRLRETIAHAIKG
jgi:ABC-type Fe3+-hydroxamate transport system substrate-binding protein